VLKHAEFFYNTPTQHIYVICTDLTTNSDYFTKQQKRFSVFKWRYSRSSKKWRAILNTT